MVNTRKSTANWNLLTGSPGFGSHILLRRDLRVPSEVLGNSSMGCSESEAWHASSGRMCRCITCLLITPPSSNAFTTTSGVLSK